MEKMRVNFSSSFFETFAMVSWNSFCIPAILSPKASFILVCSLLRVAGPSASREDEPAAGVRPR